MGRRSHVAVLFAIMASTSASGQNLESFLPLWGVPASQGEAFALPDTPGFPNIRYLADQTPSGQQTPAQQPAGQPVPAPYEKEEFPRWLQDLWRAEVIFVGALPFAYFFSLEGYDLYKWAAGDGNTHFPADLAPWPFRASTAIVYTPDEQTRIIISTLVLALGVSTADFIIGRFFSGNEKR